MSGPEKNLTLDECVEAFLGVVMSHPEKPPKTQRAQHENDCLIVGFNRAQETLRTILEHHGKTPKVRKLADTRSEGQQQPMKVGDRKLWVVG